MIAGTAGKPEARPGRLYRGMRRSSLCAGLAALTLAACAPAPRPAPAHPTPPAAAAADTKPTHKSPPEIDLEPLRIRVVTGPGGEQTLEHYDARMLLDRGNQALAEGRWDDALRIYDQLVAEFPHASVLPLAHFNAAQALEGKRQWDQAIARYRLVISSGAEPRDATDAAVRIGVIQSELERWGDAAAQFESLLARTDLEPGDRIEAMARLGYVLVEQKAYVRAEKVLSEAVSYYSRVAQTRELETNYYVAMAYYYLANIPHRQAREVPLRVTSTKDEQLHKDLEAKRKLLVLAYDRYVVALQRRNPYWATAAGYQMSQMFKDFWDDVVTAPLPANLSAREAGFYKRALHDYVRDYLEKAMYGHTKNVELAQAYRTSTEWSRASEVRAKQIAEILSREGRGELVVPDAAEPEREPARDAARPAASDYVPARAQL